MTQLEPILPCLGIKVSDRYTHKSNATENTKLTSADFRAEQSISHHASIDNRTEES
jgi:hypothetical protein